MNMIGPLLVAWRNAKGYRRERARNIRGLARAAGVVLVAGLGIGMFAAHSAKADIARASLKLGREIAPLATDGASEIRVNGQSLFLREFVTDASVSTILDDYEARCADEKGALGEFWARMPKSSMVANGHKLPTSMRSGVLRQEQQGEGVVVCLTKGKQTSPDLATAFKNFAASQDLGDLGNLRYVYVRARTDGARVVTAWTEDTFSFAKIANADGKAPGTDSRLPRPEGSRRLMTAEVVGQPYGVRVYEVPNLSPEEVGVYYDKWAASTGDWRSVAPEHPEGTMRAYFQEGTQVVVTARRTATSGTTALSIMEVVPGAKAPGAADLR